MSLRVFLALHVPCMSIIPSHFFAFNFDDFYMCLALGFTACGHDLFFVSYACIHIQTNARTMYTSALTVLEHTCMRIPTLDVCVRRTEVGKNSVL